MGLLDYILPSRIRKRAEDQVVNSLEIREREQQLRSKEITSALVKRHLLSATEDRRRPNWNALSLAADPETLNLLPMIRSRARLLADNDPKASGLIHKEKTNTIGPRFTVQAHVPAQLRRDLEIDEVRSKELTVRAEEFWNERIARDGNMDYDWRRFRSYMMYTRLKYRHFRVDGAVFVRYLFKKNRSIPFAARIIEPECIGTPPGLQGDPLVKGGLEFRKDGELRGFWVCVQHPGELLGGSSDYEFVPVRNEFGLPQMVMFFNPNRETSSRELPWLQSVLTLMNDSADYKDSELQRKKKEADIAHYITLNDPDAMQAEFESDSFGNSGTTKTGQRSQIDSPKNEVYYLEKNEGIKVVDPKRPGAIYKPFLQSIDRDIGMGVGRSFERVSNDYGAANFSATRVSGIEDFVEYETAFTEFAEVCLQADWEWAMWALALESGEPLFRSIRSSWQRYIKPSWDPMKDANAQGERLENKVLSLVEECAALGKKWETVQDNHLLVEQREQQRRQVMGMSPVPAEASLDDVLDKKLKKTLKDSIPAAADDDGVNVNTKPNSEPDNE